ncbi:HDOD domain-containing protein [Desulfopila sp. IMCC35006]|uniref:HDOD domain-containing protein n=1 Tax=Desulfopila sp. IMCC35006 TaxID=2569542 RepID=UPI0010AD1FA9|nr:HDOD domain-containing protein [Desulfopila sp. IMCC35006]TKB23317.1 HDOD domain-containing protein [Desulfopila sp. IMCC35006]
MISKDNTFSLIQKSGNLPTLPAILIKLLAACDDEDTAMADIAAIISRDPVLTCKVLQLVNSTYYGCRYSFSNIEQAVVYLGENTIKNLAITMSVHQVFGHRSFTSLKKFNINVFWYHSLLCATLARRIAQRIGFANIEEAYLAGLLHDIGRLILVATFPAEHETILARTKNRQNTLWAEKQLLGVMHSETGGWLLQKWRLNSMLADAVAYHHESPDRIKEAFPLVRIIYTANLLCQENDIGEQKYADADLLTGLDHDALEEIVEGAEEEVEGIAISLEIKIEKPAGNAAPSPINDSTSSDDPEGEATACPAATTPPEDTADTQQEKLQQALTARVKSVSLLSSFLENLAHAADTEQIMAACEQAMSILFTIEKVLFFLPDSKNLLLKGRTSPDNRLHQASQGLTLTVPKSSSLIVKTYHDMAITSLTTEKPAENLADRQILTILDSDTILLVPLVADKKPTGVILLGLPDKGDSLTQADHKLIQVVIHQVSLCLQLERMKEQKAAELDAARMAAVSMTARKVAHEINNPLGIISNYIASIKLKNSADNAIQNELDIIDEEIQRISSMIRQLDIFSKDPVFHFAVTDVNATIKGIVQLLNAAHSSSPGIDISFLPDKTLPRIMTSNDGLKQILINLLKNAAEAMPDGGSITVETRQSAPEATTVKKGIEIVVTDTGPGLPDLVKNRLFAPFVTTKQNGHSGLGLSIVHKTVKDLDGTITCTSNPLVGTCFVIYLPDSGQNELPRRT